VAQSDFDADRWPHLYEAFLTRARPGARHGHGVYFTPVPVVHAQIRLVEQLLRERLGCADGFADEGVLIVDPAVGAGTYPCSVLQRVGDRAGVMGRMRLFETQPGAAALARARGLPVEERDALEVELDSSAPIVACLGNPPYRRHAASLDARSLLAAFSQANGVHRKNLYNEYVSFWRWAVREVLERRRGAGVVCFVTAASYLRGPAFAGVRCSLREAFDELWVIDLEGDQRAARASHNVFPIRTPVAITLGVRYAAETHKHVPIAEVHYARLEGSANDKLRVLEAVESTADLAWSSVDRVSAAPMVAVRRSAYSTWPALTDLFPWQVSGAQLKRTWPIAPTREVLHERWQRLLNLDPDERAAAFGPTRDRTIDSAPADLLDSGRRLPPLRKLSSNAACIEPVRYAYRAFDRHWVLPDARCGDFPRPRLWRTCGPRQVFLTSMLTNVIGAGPAAIATALVPDLDHFRGSFGARGVIPLWLDPEGTRPNIQEQWLAGLSEHYGREVSPGELMAYCYALLTSFKYTSGFADELRTPGPRVPLTSDPHQFERTAAAGKWLIGLHTFGTIHPGQTVVLRDLSQAQPRTFGFDAHRQVVTVGDGAFGPVSREAWQFSVSGYAVLGSWLRRRTHRPARSPLERLVPPRWTEQLSREFLELCWLVQATLDAQSKLDALLEEAVSGRGFERALAQVRQ
jgi:hypothetical protein